MARSVESSRDSGQSSVSAWRIDRIDGLLVLDDAGQDGAEPLRVGLAVERAVDFLAEPERLVFGGDLEQAAAGDVHLVERLHGRQPGGAPLVGLPDGRLIAAGGLRHRSGSEPFAQARSW